MNEIDEIAELASLGVNPSNSHYDTNDKKKLVILIDELKRNLYESYKDAYPSELEEQQEEQAKVTL
jgi:hypothetical protein